MKSNYNFIPLVSFLIVILILYYCLIPNKVKSYNLNLNQQQLTLLNGDNLNLNKFAGRNYVIHIFASWCGICKNDLKNLTKLKSITDVNIVGIASNDSIMNINRFIKLYGVYDYIALDRDLVITKLLKSRAVPETIIVNGNNDVIFRHLGELDQNLVKQIADNYLLNEAVEN